MYLIVIKDAVLLQEKLSRDDREFCGEGWWTIIDISNPKKPLKYCHSAKKKWQKIKYHVQ